MSDVEMMKCKLCRFEIPSNAIKCGHCHEFVNFMNLRNINWITYLFLFSVIVLVINVYEPFKIKREEFSPKSKLKIISHQIHKTKTVDPYIEGVVKNDEAFDWRSVTIEAKFYNKEGEYITSSSDYGIELKAGQEKPFIIKPHYDPMWKFKSFDKYEVSISSAY